VLVELGRLLGERRREPVEVGWYLNVIMLCSAVPGGRTGVGGGELALPGSGLVLPAARSGVSGRPLPLLTASVRLKALSLVVLPATLDVMAATYALR
jgi:hypothetical protein